MSEIRKLIHAVHGPVPHAALELLADAAESEWKVLDAAAQLGRDLWKQWCERDARDAQLREALKDSWCECAGQGDGDDCLHCVVTRWAATAALAAPPPPSAPGSGAPPA